LEDNEERGFEDLEKKYVGSKFGKSEDEMKVLTVLEMYMTEDKLAEALRMIKWRKKIIKLAMMNGWGVAGMIAERTVGKLGKIR
jgi:hypothetical protein